MKIYCSRRKPEFEDFVGKDVWVKCNHPSLKGDWYLRIQDISGDRIWYNEITSGYINDNFNFISPGALTYIKSVIADFPKTNHENLSSGWKSEGYFGNKCWRIVEPIETYTSEELVELLESYNNTLPDDNLDNLNLF